ncbi:MAG: hypothetical protein ACAH06_04200 [Methylophilaceae bacterium]|jgi:hypothetical protein
MTTIGINYDVTAGKKQNSESIVEHATNAPNTANGHSPSQSGC